MSEEQVVDTQVEAPEVDYEKEARLQNWVPREEWKGRPEEWTDAETFVKKGWEITPILRENNKRLMREIEKQRKEMDELRSATTEFKKFQKEQNDRKVAQLESEIKSLREQKKSAISSGDGELAVSIDERIDELKTAQFEAKVQAKEEPPSPAQADIPPEVAEWAENNKWYTSNVRMKAAADVIAEDIQRTQPWLTGREFLNELDKALEENFGAERLGRQTNTAPRSPVEGATSQRNSGGKGKTYNDLPGEAKAACDQFVRQKLMTKEEYVASYFA